MLIKWPPFSSVLCEPKWKRHDSWRALTTFASLDFWSEFMCICTLISTVFFFLNKTILLTYNVPLLSSTSMLSLSFSLSILFPAQLSWPAFPSLRGWSDASSLPTPKFTWAAPLPQTASCWFICRSCPFFNAEHWLTFTPPSAHFLCTFPQAPPKNKGRKSDLIWLFSLKIQG